MKQGTVERQVLWVIWARPPSQNACITNPHSPKKHGLDKLCMVINQSVGEFAPNTMIKREDIRGFPLDNMKHLGVGLLARHREKPDKSFVIYKSDVLKAYHLLPMHPLCHEHELQGWGLV